MYTGKIRKLGFNVDAKKIFTSGEATSIYLRKHTNYQKIFLVGTPALEMEFIEAGYELTSKAPQAVVLGFDTTLTYEKIWKACDLIRERITLYRHSP